MGRRVVLGLIVVGIAYGVGWMSDAVLNDDPCRLRFRLARVANHRDDVRGGRFARTWRTLLAVLGRGSER